MSLSSRQFVRNSAWTLLELTVYPALMILATPVFISKLGIEHYGLWMLVSTITLGMNVLNIGVGETNIRLISRYRGENNLEQVRRVFNHNFSLSLAICVLAIVAGLIFYATDFITIFYKGEHRDFAGKVLLLASVSAGIKFVEIALLSVFKAFERFDISSKLILISKNSVMILNLVLVVLGYDLITIFICSAVMNLLNVTGQMGVLFFFERGLLSWPNFSFLGQKLDQLNYNFWYWLQSVVALLGFLADKLLVAYFTDVKTLGYYSVASLIGTQIHNFFLAFGSFIFPRVSISIAEKKDLSRIYFIARSLVALPGWAIISLLIVFGDWIFRLWLGAETFSQSIYFIRLYLVFEAGMLLIIVPYHFINGTRNIRLNSLFEVVIRCTHFASMLAGYSLAGVNGIVYGLIISTLVNIPFQYFFFHNYVLPGSGTWQFVFVLLPVFCLAGLVLAEAFLIKAALLICFALMCKEVYFDPARAYSKNSAFFGQLFHKLENK